jgi:hypothetical protein
MDELGPALDEASFVSSFLLSDCPLILELSATFETVFPRRLGEMAIFSLLAKFATARFGGREVDAPDDDGPSFKKRVNVKVEKIVRTKLKAYLEGAPRYL